LVYQSSNPAVVGAVYSTLLVIVTVLLYVVRVSTIISSITPLIIVAVVVAFIHTLLTMPPDTAALDSFAAQTASPVRPWWLSGINYTGMALLLGVSMCLVLGGTVPAPREGRPGGPAGRGV